MLGNCELDSDPCLKALTHACIAVLLCRWYRRASPPIFRGGRHAPSSLTATKLVSPLLLRLMWDGKPLHYTRDYGWGWIFPSVCCRQVKAGELTAKADQSVLCSTDGGRAASPEEASARRFIRAVKTLSSVELR